MLKFAIPAVAALALIAFAARSQATNADREIGPDAMGWRLSQEGDMAKLAYGVANSDQLAVMMTCEPGLSQAVVYGDVRLAGAHLVRTSLGPMPIDPLSGDLAAETRISTDDPALLKLAHRGTLAIEGEAGMFELTAGRDERRLIDQFFAYCGTGRI